MIALESLFYFMALPALVGGIIAWINHKFTITRRN